MSYGKHRFLYENEIEESMITVSSQVPGIVAGTLKTGTGSALLQAVGQYSGETDLTYTVQIHDVSVGTEIGEAKYRWRTSDTAADTWEASNITTHSTASTLSNAFSIRFIAGVGADFVINDTWVTQAYATWGAGRFLDNNRGTYFRLDALTGNIVIDFGTPVEITSHVLLDHNLTSSATFTVQMNASDSWGAPSYNQVVAVTAGEPISLYSGSQTYRYLRYVFSDGTNTDAYLEVGEIFAGDYMELSVRNASWGSTEELRYNKAESQNPMTGKRRESIMSDQLIYVLPFSVIDNANIILLKTMLNVLKNPVTRVSKPFFFHLFSDEPDTLIFARITSPLVRSFVVVDLNSTSLRIEEEVKSRL